MPAADVLARLEARAEGLSTDEARARLARFGPNQLPAPPRRSAVRRFLAQCNNVLIWVLLAAAVITAFLGEWTDTSVILGVVLVNATIGFIQEGRAEHALEAIGRLLSPQAVALRDGTQATLPAAELAPGDIVLLQPGDLVPADLRLMHCRNLQIDEAILSGESAPVAKRVEAVPASALLGDRVSMAWSGTLVTRGTGSGVVVATGSETEIGRISLLLARVEELATPLTRQLARFGKLLSGVIGVIAGLTMALGVMVHGYGLHQMFLAAVGLAVAAIPEGLPAIITITLAIGVQRMARRNAIIRQLPAVETLGSVSVICSDKTGTLTRNEMMASRVVLPGMSYEVTGDGLAVVLGLALPITPVQILWVNMITAVTLSIALAFEPAEHDLMRRPPRCPDEPLLGGFVAWRIAFVSAIVVAGTFSLFVHARAQGYGLEAARTLAVNALVMFEACYLLNVRHIHAPTLNLEGLLGNRIALAGIAAVFGFELLLTHLPLMNRLFATAPLALADWLLVLLVAFTVVPLVELEKYLWRRHEAGPRQLKAS